jgi:hypothetical protein
MQVNWPTSPVTGNETELISILVPKGVNEQGRGRDLPLHRRLQIENQAAKMGMNQFQALSLRRQLMMAMEYKSGRNNSMQNKKMGDQASQANYSQMFEDECIMYSRSINIPCLSDGEQKNVVVNSLREKSISQFGAISIVESLIHAWAPYHHGKGGLPTYRGPCFGCQTQIGRRKLPSKDNFAYCVDCFAPPIRYSSHLLIYPNDTPDILFSEKVIINGQNVNWIECKAYYGSGMLVNGHKYKKCKQLACSKIAGQAERYRERYGPGAIVFLRGFHSSLRIPGTILLDTTPFDISKFNA